MADNFDSMFVIVDGKCQLKEGARGMRCQRRSVAHQDVDRAEGLRRDAMAAGYPDQPPNPPNPNEAAAK